MGWELAAFTIISLAISFIASRIQQRQMEKAIRALEKEPDIGTQIKANTRSTSAPLKKVYGQLKIGSNTVYMATQGKKNNDLYLVDSLCEGEIEGLIYDEDDKPYIWFDGERITDKLAGCTKVDIDGVIGAVLSKIIDGDDVAEYELYNGTFDQNCCSIISDSNSEFTDTMRGTAYCAWHLYYIKDVYRGVPTILYLIKGLKLYDFRTGQTEWSANPVLALYDFLTDTESGCGINSNSIPTEYWEEAADYCDTKGFTCNMAVMNENNVWDTVENILALFRGSLNYWDGKYYIRYRDLNEESSQMTIEDEHILQDSDGKAMISISDPGYYDIPKGLKVTYLNSDDYVYSENSFIIGEEDGVLGEINLAKGCTDREMAGILATSALESQQIPRTISGRFRDDCLILEPNDVVTFNSTALGISDQTMRVASAVYTNLGFIDLVLTYDDISVYNDVYDIIPENVYQTDLPNPDEPSLIENATIEETLYTQRLRTFIKLDIEFNIPENTWFDYAEVWISTNGDVDANYKHMYNVSDDFTIDPVEEGEVYYIKLRSVNTFGVKQTLENANKLSKTIIGKSQTPPSSIAFLNAIAGDGSVSLRSDKLNDPDIEIYEFRVGSQWAGALFLSAKRSPHEELNLVKPGDHTFWCNTKGTNGLYGETPRSADITTYVPNGYTSYTSFTDDYSDGGSKIFSNTEQTSYSGNYYLKCSHYGGDTTGYYVSNVFDTGIAAQQYYTYLDTEFVTLGAGTTWNDLFYDSTTTIWTDVNISSRTWQDMFELEEASQVEIIIYYKAELGHDWSEITNAEILAGVVNARYFQVRIDIVDPATNINTMVKEYSLKLYT